LPKWLAHDALRNGLVLQVLPSRRSEVILVQLWPRTRHASRRARIVIDELAAHTPSVLQAGS
jgi:DNA-binding transcriptional LysR family regulator